MNKSETRTVLEKSSRVNGADVRESGGDLAPLGLRFIVDREVGDFNCVEDLL